MPLENIWHIFMTFKKKCSFSPSTTMGNSRKSHPFQRQVILMWVSASSNTISYLASGLTLQYCFLMNKIEIVNWISENCMDKIKCTSPMVWHYRISSPEYSLNTYEIMLTTALNLSTQPWPTSWLLVFAPLSSAHSTPFISRHSLAISVFFPLL